MNFQKAITIIAILFLIILLLGMWYIFSRGKNNTKFPPMVAQCPDYWKLNKKNECVNVKNLGNGCKKLNIEEGKFQGGHQGLVEKCKWAKNCGVVWDGITNTQVC